jgi:hypothetical protein
MVKLTKDEAIIVSAVIESGWDYFLKDELSRESRNEKAVFLQNLANRLDEEGTDRRRQGRTSNNDFNDIWKRALKKGVKNA